MNLKEPLVIGKTNRSKSEEIYVGGKGNNVATVLKNLGEDVCPVTVVAGFTGQKVADYLEENFKQSKAIFLKEGLTRFVLNIKAGKETGVNGNGPAISEDDFQRVLAYLKGLQDGDFLCISGSIPSSLADDSYARILDALSDKKIDIAVDASKALLLNTLKHHPFLIKPNLDELGAYFGVQLDTKEESIPYLFKLQQMGARNIICSMGGDGAEILTEDGHVYFLPAPEGELVNSVGAGDSMIAGFLAAYNRTHDYGKAFRNAVACGSATAFSPGLTDRETAERVLASVSDLVELPH